MLNSPQDEMDAADMPYHYRDYCAHMWIDMKECRQNNTFMWRTTCAHSIHQVRRPLHCLVLACLVSASTVVCLTCMVCQPGLMSCPASCDLLGVCLALICFVYACLAGYAMRKSDVKSQVSALMLDQLAIDSCRRPVVKTGCSSLHALYALQQRHQKASCFKWNNSSSWFAA